MKRSLFWLGAAAMALASCTNSEVMEVAGNKAIGFSSFVNNNTKAVVPITSTTSFTSANFYVFGEYGDATSGWTKNGQAFNNELGSAVYYWQPSQTYRFGAYADGAEGKLDDTKVSFSATDQELTFTNYKPDDDKDLVAAVTGDISADTYISSKGKVDLNFKHMLSQVKLTFTTDAAATYALTIKNVKIEQAVSTCTGTYDGTPAWETSTGTKGEYEYGDFNPGQVISKDAPKDQTKLVIPQACNAGDLKVTFTASIEGEKPAGSTTLTKDFTATLAHNLTTSGATANEWTAGYCYNYTAQIDIDDIVNNASSLVPITFNPSVTDWIDAGNTDVTPNAVP